VCIVNSVIGALSGNDIELIFWAGVFFFAIRQVRDPKHGAWITGGLALCWYGRESIFAGTDAVQEGSGQAASAIRDNLPAAPVSDAVVQPSAPSSPTPPAITGQVVGGGSGLDASTVVTWLLVGALTVGLILGLVVLGRRVWPGGRTSGPFVESSADDDDGEMVDDDGDGYPDDMPTPEGAST
jgi:hypothetical protein